MIFFSVISYTQLLSSFRFSHYLYIFALWLNLNRFILVYPRASAVKYFVSW